jgi:RNA polymerase sigma-70 factor, ECF subfamily
MDGRSVVTEQRREIASPAAVESGAGVTVEGVTLEQAFRAHASYVATIGYRMLGTRDELDDLVQDVFLSAQRTLHRLRHVDAIRGWLATVTVRVARQRLRARRLRRFLHLPTSSATEDVPDRGASAETKSLVKAIFRALDTLPVNARLAWSLRYLQGERLESVALLCGCSLAAVKRRLARAQAVLDQILEIDDSRHG